MPRRFILRCSTLLLLLGGAAVNACTICSGPSLDGLSIEHPQSLQISIATYEAIAREELPSMEAIESSSDELEAGMAPGWILLKELIPAEASSTASELLLVDKGVRRKLIPRGSTHKEASVQIVTTSITLHAILKKKISLEKALAAHLVIIEPTSPKITDTKDK